MGGGKYCAALALKYFTVFLGKPLDIRFAEAGGMADSDYPQSLEDFHGLNSGVAFGGIVAATLMMNFRHFLMSASLSRRIDGSTHLLPLIAFGITDETFAIASAQEGRLHSGFLLGLEAVAYVSWVSGTAAGYSLGRLLPDILQRSLGISLYALFIAILVPAVRRNWRAAVVAAAAGLCHTLLDWLSPLPSGWNIILAIVAGSVLGAVLFPGGLAQDHVKEEGRA